MKVVLFCGGLGMRIRPLAAGAPGSAEVTPKPMVAIGGKQPLLWNVMKYYAHFGHTEFILCLGHGADTIKRFFLDYNEYIGNDFVMTNGGRNLELLHSDIDAWRIHFIDTGLNASVGERLWRVRHMLQGEEMFLANYSDGLTDLPLPAYIDTFTKSGKAAACVTVRPPGSAHIIRFGEDDFVKSVENFTEADIWVNGGYFVFRPALFDYMRKGEELVREPFQRLIEARQLMGYRYDGFWQCCDTFKEKEDLDLRYALGDRPWQVWETVAHTAEHEA